MTVVSTAPLEARFWAKVDRRGPENCWPWKASKKAGGYGQFGVIEAGKFINRTAHRVSWFLHFGEWPEFHVRHLCHNPDCCNPNHLALGTARENHADNEFNPNMLRRKIRGALSRQRRNIGMNDFKMKSVAAKPSKRQTTLERRNIVVEGLKSGKTLAEIGGELGVTRQRVQQVAKAAGHSQKREVRDNIKVLTDFLAGKGFIPTNTVYQGLMSAGMSYNGAAQTIMKAWRRGLIVKHYGGLALVDEAKATLKEPGNGTV